MTIGTISVCYQILTLFLPLNDFKHLWKAFTTFSVFKRQGGQNSNMLTVKVSERWSLIFFSLGNSKKSNKKENGMLFLKYHLKYRQNLLLALPVFQRTGSGNFSGITYMCSRLFIKGSEEKTQQKEGRDRIKRNCSWRHAKTGWLRNVWKA